MWAPLGERRSLPKCPVTALGINKDQFEAHLNLGVALRLKGQPDEAISECQAAIRINKENASAHDQLGLALQAKGRLKDAVAEYHEAIRLQKNNASAKDHLRQAERLVQLKARLPGALGGKEKSKDATELLAFAQLCLPPYSPHYAASARFFSEAFAVEPKLAENLQASHRYNAACAAALSGCGQGKDADKLDAIKARGKLLVGVTESSPPFSYRDGAKGIVGYDVDLAERVAHRLGVTVEKIPIINAERIPAASVYLERVSTCWWFVLEHAPRHPPTA